MVVIYSMGLTKCFRVPLSCYSLLNYNKTLLDLNECVWIVPGTFDTLYN